MNLEWGVFVTNKPTTKWMIPSTLLLASLLSFCDSEQAQEANIDQTKLDQIQSFIAAQNPEFQENESNEEDSTDDLDPLEILSIKVFPSQIKEKEGLRTDFRVVGVQRNGVEKTIEEGVTFIFENEKVGSISDDLESAKFFFDAALPGETKVTMTWRNVVGDFVVTSLAKQISTIEINPKSVPLGAPTLFSLSIEYDNLTSEEIAEGVLWTIDDADFMSQDGVQANLLTGIKVGTSGVRANYLGFDIGSRTSIQMPKLASIEVKSDSLAVLLGSLSDIQAEATFANGSKFDITSSVVWESDNEALATISADGEMEAIFPGEVTISARFGDIVGRTSFIVTSEDYQSFRLEPENVSIPVGLSQQFTLWGILEDSTEENITNLVRWTSANPSVAKSGGAGEEKVRGLLTGLFKGDTVLTAKYGNSELSTNVTVTDAALVGIEISSENPDGPCGVNQPEFTAIGIFSDNTQQDVTESVFWAVEPEASGTAGNTAPNIGIITTTEPGNATVTASFYEASTDQTISASAPIEIGAAVQMGIGITAPLSSIPLGVGLQLEAGPLMSCGNGVPFTEQASWSSSNDSIAPVSNDVGTKGSVVAQGTVTTTETVTITATYQDYVNTFELEVRPKEVVSVVALPTLTRIDVGGNTASMIVQSQFTDGSSEDMTNIASFPGYALVYSLVDCNGGDCASIDANTGVVTSTATEGEVSVLATLTKPDGSVFVSPGASIDIASKCTPPTGIRSGLYCVYLGTKGDSCDTVCGAVGTYHEATHKVFGSEGTSQSCDDALEDVGYVRGLENNKFTGIDLGLGCAIWDITVIGELQSIRASSVTTNAAAASDDFQRICACRETP